MKIKNAIGLKILIINYQYSPHKVLCVSINIHLKLSKIYNYFFFTVFKYKTFFLLFESVTNKFDNLKISYC